MGQNRQRHTFINVAPGPDAGLQRGDIKAVLSHLQQIADQFVIYGDDTDQGAA
jgi:hypothetical protein